MILEFLTDPTIWAGLIALIVLEVVLGIDNLVFIAILVQKLPPHQRDRARVTGLTLALLMRFLLLFSVVWLATLTQTIFSYNDFSFSWRDVILFIGGIFLIAKATMELHERIEGRAQVTGQKIAYSTFAIVIAQIVIIDAVFSIDSVITAIGMTDQLAVMMIAMSVAMLLMLLASKQITEFIDKHPTLIILCLGFLLLIGFSLIAEGLGFAIPKGYLYVAIGFSVLVEVFNQISQYNRDKWMDGAHSIRDRTVNNMLRMMGVSLETQNQQAALEEISEEAPQEETIFQENEKDMIRGILALDTTNIKALMTQRRDLDMLDLNDSQEEKIQQLSESPYSRLIIIQDGQQDEPLGIIHKNQLFQSLLKGEELNLEEYLEQPLVFIENLSVLKALESFKSEGQKFAFVVDEFGVLEGIITLTDIVEAITGEIEQEHSDEQSVIATHQGSYLVDASESIEMLNRDLPTPLPRSQDYTTLAGLILDQLERMPKQGESLTIDTWCITITQADPIKITQVELEQIQPQDN